VSSSPAARNSVLIVEDEFLLATEMRSALNQAGFEVLPLTSSAEEAIKLARAHYPAIALVDIELLGGESGIELASKLRMELNIPSIFVSGH